MATLILRQSRPAGQENGLTNAEIDANFQALNADVATKATPAEVSSAATSSANAAIAAHQGAASPHGFSAAGLALGQAATHDAQANLLPPATTTAKGVMSPAMFDKLAGIQAGAQVNPLIADQAEAEAGVDPAKMMTAQRVAQAIAALAPDGGFVVTSQANAEAGANNTEGMTALRTEQALLARGGVSRTGAMVSRSTAKRRTNDSTAVSLAMEAFVQESPNGGRAISPTAAEGDEVYFSPGKWTQVLPFAFSQASGSNYGVRFIGAGTAATIIEGPATAAPAQFAADGTYRMLDMRPVDSARQQEWRIEGIGLKCMFTQNGDGSTNLSSPVRVIDTDYMVHNHFRDVSVYLRQPGHRSETQFALYLKRAYYADLSALTLQGFYVLNAGPGINGATQVGYGAIGLGIEECNALTVIAPAITGFHSAFLFDNDHGVQVYGAKVEHTNWLAIARNGSYSCEIHGGYREMHKIDSGSALGTRTQEGILRAGATTRHNRVYIAQGQSDARIGDGCVDRSPGKTNKVVVTGQMLRPAYSARPLPTAAVSSSVSVTASSDRPSNFPGQVSERVAWAGSYGQGRYWVVSGIDPRCGTARVLWALKRVSGDGMMNPLLTSAGLLGTNTVAWGTLLDPHKRFGAAGIGAIALAASGHSYSSANGGEVTLNCVRPHLVQAGLRLVPSGTIGSSGNPLPGNVYVRATPSEHLMTIGVATGTLADPGTIAGGTLTIPADMYEWLGQPDATRDWLTIDRAVPLSYNVVAVSLTIANIPVVTLDRTAAAAGITNGSKLMLWGFDDARLDGVLYTAQTADISGSAITLTALGAMPGLLTTNNGLDSTAVVGKIGFTELNVALIGKTTGGAACVWGVTRPLVLAGDGEGCAVIEGPSDVPGVLPSNVQVGTAYTAQISDAGQTIDMNNAAANTVTIPANASVPFEVGTLLAGTTLGAGLTTIAGAGGVTLTKPASRSFTTSAQYEAWVAKKTGTDAWLVTCS